MNQFTYQETLSNQNFRLQALKEQDFTALYQVGSNPSLWAGHPSPDRFRPENFKTWFAKALDSKQALIIEDLNTNKVIGSTRFYDYDKEKSVVFIGYTFIAQEYWGGKVNKEIKELMLNYAFQFVDSVLFDVDPKNIRSQKALEKIGARFSHKEKKALSKDTEYLVYKITQ